MTDLPLALTFDYAGKQVTIDLSIYGQAGDQLSPGDRASRASDLLSQMTLLVPQMELHCRSLRRELREQFKANLPPGTKLVKTQRDEWVDDHPEYLSARTLREQLKGIRDSVLSNHAVRMRRLEDDAASYARAQPRPQ